MTSFEQCTMVSYFIDLQGFKIRKNEFVVKEIYITNFKDFFFHTTVKPPQSFESLSVYDKCQINWLKKNFHGIGWEDGCITQSQLSYLLDCVLDAQDRVFVKGSEKKKWIKNICCNDFTVIDLESYGFNHSLNNCNVEIETNHICKNHRKIKTNKNPQCTVRNILIVKNWIKSGGFFKKGYKNLSLDRIFI